MKKSHSYRPQLEVLEGRELPSTARVIVLPFIPAPTPHHNTAHHVVHLHGQIFGIWSTQPTLPDTGTTQLLHGGGMVSPLGQVQASGTLHTPGFVATGHTTGMLTLRSGKNSVTLSLIGPTQPGFSRPPSSLHFSVVSGTGAYAGATGSGTAHFREVMAQMPHCPPGALCPLFIIAPSFTLTLL
jgi:hypothetical protein